MMHPRHPRFLASYTPRHDSPGDATCAAWLPCGERLILGTSEGFITAITHDGEELWRAGGYGDRRFTRKKRTGARQTSITCLARSNDGALTLAGCVDHQLLLLENNDGERVGYYEGKGADVAFVAVVFSPNGSEVVATTSAGRLYHWHVDNLRAGARPTWTVNLNTTGLALAWPSESIGLLIGCEDGSLQTRDFNKRRTPITLREDLGAFRTIDARGESMLWCTTSGVWRQENAASDPSLILENDYRAACWNGESALLFSCLEPDGELSTWDLEGQIDRWQGAKRASLYSCLAASPDGTWLAASGNSNAVTIWRAARDVSPVEPTRPALSKLAPQLPDNVRADSSGWSSSIALGQDAPGEILWSAALPNRQTRRFIADTAHIYLDAAGTPLGALRASDGEVAWSNLKTRHIASHSTPPITHTGWLGDHRVITTARYTACFTPGGEIRWLLPCDGLSARHRAHTLMQVGDDRFMHMTARGSLALCDIERGAVRWSQPRQPHHSRAIAIDAAHSYLIDEHDSLHKLPHDHKYSVATIAVSTSWKHELIWYSARYLILRTDSRFFFIDIEEDELIFDYGIPHLQQLAVHADGMIIALDSEGTLYGAHPFEESKDWYLDVSGEHDAIAFTLTASEIILPRPGTILFVEPEDGSVRFEQPLGDRSATAPITTAPNRLYVACDRELLAIGFGGEEPESQPLEESLPHDSSAERENPGQENLTLYLSDEEHLFDPIIATADDRPLVAADELPSLGPALRERVRFPDIESIAIPGWCHPLGRVPVSADGALVWRDEVLVAVSDLYGLIAIDMHTGQRRWALDADEAILGVAPVGEHLVVRTARSKLVAIDALGQVVWTRDIEGELRTWLPCERGVLLWTEGKECFVIDAAGAMQRIGQLMHELSKARPALDRARGRVIAHRGKHVRGIDLESGDVVWDREMSGYLENDSEGVLIQDIFIVPTRQQSLAALAAGDGALLWEADFEGVGYPRGALAVAGGEVLLHTSRPNPHDDITQLRYDAKTGRERARRTISKRLHGLSHCITFSGGEVWIDGYMARCFMTAK